MLKNEKFVEKFVKEENEKFVKEGNEKFVKEELFSFEELKKKLIKLYLKKDDYILKLNELLKKEESFHNLDELRKK